ncbi:TPA: HNH endonuclease [Pasteurella multocida]|uniref:HNH endonuclease signature motif containing protein n=2 Tax=Pasteurella multocida TaxID=747 RepID=UPI000DFA5F31|nr:HNH endonuclease signature motif containing protein [Pasteurella multocida]MCL7786933.1 HNH endonuclease [Pasteurella multocida]MEB3483586.1 HNH endonuclease signature motif containing protein [Pasteurella multocida]MEB3493973.1 HNH endonuclease signature motif containing protein [Pasteurella multocida]MEB3502805.1 HNH endonuclease signature motif containing protein [Pasteurella multocida]URI01795.1 HNH endonuclease [Pasteurella multocida]
MSKKTMNALLSRGIPSDLASSLSSSFTLHELQCKNTSELTDLGLSDLQIDSIITRTSRQPIPPRILNQVLIKSKYCCVICRNMNNPIIIHHIEPWSISKNHSETNLVVLCLNCHSKIHSKNEIARNITAAELVECKRKWEEKCLIEDTTYLLTLSQKSCARWDWFNITRIRDLVTGNPQYLNTESSIFKQLAKKEMIDYDNFLDMGKMQELAKPSHFTDFGDGSLAVQYLNSIVYNIINDIRFFDVTTFLASRSNILKDIISIGQNIAFQGRFYFKDIDGGKREAYYKKKGIKIKFVYDPYYCASSSSKYDSMVGNHLLTIFGRVIDITVDEDDIVHISLSCLVAGSYFQLHKDKAYYIYEPEIDEISDIF